MAAQRCSSLPAALHAECNRHAPKIYEFIIIARQNLVQHLICKMTLVIDQFGKIYGSEGDYRVRQDAFWLLDSDEFKNECINFCSELLKDFVANAKIIFKRQLTHKSGLAAYADLQHTFVRGLRRQLHTECQAVDPLVDAITRDFLENMFRNTYIRIPPSVLVQCVFQY